MSSATDDPRAATTAREQAASDGYRPDRSVPPRRREGAEAAMQAIVCFRYGPPEVAELRQVAIPVPQADEVRVRVRATSVGPSDCAFRSGRPLFARLYSGLRSPRFPVLGTAFAGDVDAVGTDVRGLTQGLPVFGLSVKRFGAHAEYLCLPEDALVAAMTPRMSYDDAVCVLDGTTALTFLRDVARVQRAQRVLINGASGAVGAYAVQLAKHLGAHVTGVSSTGNLALVAALGADEVIDYTQEDFTESSRRYDIVFDAVGKSSFTRCKRSLTRAGHYLTTAPSPGALMSMLTTKIAGGRKSTFAATGLMQTQANLSLLGELFEADALRPVIDRRYPLAEIADAYRYVETGRKKGTAVVTL